MNLITRYNPAWSEEELADAQRTREEQVEYLKKHDPTFLALLSALKQAFGGFESVRYTPGKDTVAGDEGAGSAGPV